MNKKIYFPNLDVLRSIAALMVLLSHILSEYLSIYFPNALWYTNPVAQFFLRNGGFGVQIFFALSGFLITYLLLSEMKDTGTINLRHFLIRRVLRIWPVYFLVVFFVFIVYGGVKSVLGMTSPIHESFLMSLFFLSNYDLIGILSDSTKYANGMLSLTWSVSVEEQFYLIWPLLFVLVTLKRVQFAIISVIVIGILFMFSWHDDMDLVYHHTISNFVFLGTGALVAYLHIFNNRNLEFFMIFSKKLWLLIIFILLIILIFSNSYLITYSYGSVIYFVIKAIFLFFLLLLLTANVQRPFELSNITFLKNMAIYTYGLYMYHRIAGFILETSFYKILKFDNSMLIDGILMVFQFCLTFIMAYLSYQYMEKPLLKLKNKFSLFHK